MLSAAKLPREPRESKSRCRKTPDGLAALQKAGAPNGASAPAPFKFSWCTLTGVLLTEPKRVHLIMGDPSDDLDWSSGHAILQLQDGRQVEVFCEEDEDGLGKPKPSRFLTRYYHKGDRVTLGGLLTAKGVFHVHDVPVPEGR